MSTTLPIQSLNIGNVDLVYLVSQETIQTGLMSFFYQQSVEFSFAAKYVENSQQQSVLTICAMDDPAAIFTFVNGRLGLPPAQNGTEPYILDLSQGSLGSSQVICNLGITAGTLQIPPGSTGVAVGSATWPLTFTTQLSQQVAPTSNQSNYTSLVQQYGDIFSLNQLLVDLTAAQYESSSADSVPAAVAEAGGEYDLVWPAFIQAISLYLQANGSTVFDAGQPMLGSVALVTGPSQTEVSLPPVTVTDCTFCIIPNSATGAEGASVLAYVCMTNSNPMPNAPQSIFTDFIPVLTSAELSDQIYGYAVFSPTMLTNALQQQLPSLSSYFATYLVSNVSAAASSSNWTASTLSNPDPMTFAGSFPSNIASYAMPQQFSNSVDWDTGVGYAATSNSTATVTLLEESGTYIGINLTGIYSTTLHFQSGDATRDMNSWESPLISFSWNVAYTLQIQDNDGNGSGILLQFDSGLSDTTAAPTFTGSGESDWLGHVPSNSELASYYSGPLGDIATELSSLETVGFPSIGLFAFPGAGDYFFKQPAINTAYNLYCQLETQG